MSAESDLVIAAAHGAREQGDWLRANCPFCELSTGKPDRRESLAISKRSGWYRCWKCSAKGVERSIVGDDVGIWDWDVEATAAAVEAAFAAVVPPPDGFTPLGTPAGMTARSTRRAREYMAQRGLPDPELWRDVGIGVTIGGWMGGRIVVPLVDGGKWRGYAARLYRGTHPAKYLYPKGMSRTTMFNAAALDAVTDTPLLIVEGVFDALPYWPDATACLGKPTNAHVDRILQACRPIVIALDGDAWREGWAFAALLSSRLERVAAVRLPPCEDPGSVSSKWLRNRAIEAIDNNATASKDTES